jgi:hypothetical protein
LFAYDLRPFFTLSLSNLGLDSESEKSSSNSSSLLGLGLSARVSLDPNVLLRASDLLSLKEAPLVLVALFLTMRALLSPDSLLLLGLKSSSDFANERLAEEGLSLSEDALLLSEVGLSPDAGLSLSDEGRFLSEEGLSLSNDGRSLEAEGFPLLGPVLSLSEEGRFLSEELSLSGNALSLEEDFLSLSGLVLSLEKEDLDSPLGLGSSFELPLGV